MLPYVNIKHDSSPGLDFEHHTESVFSNLCNVSPNSPNVTPDFLTERLETKEIPSRVMMLSNL